MPGVALRTPLLARVGAWGAVPAGCAADAHGPRAAPEARFKVRRVPRDVPWGDEADPVPGACVAAPGCVTHGMLPRKLHHCVVRKGTAVFAKHEPEQAPDVLIRAPHSRQETRG